MRILFKEKLLNYHYREVNGILDSIYTSPLYLANSYFYSKTTSNPTSIIYTYTLIDDNQQPNKYNFIYLKAWQKMNNLKRQKNPPILSMNQSNNQPTLRTHPEISTHLPIFFLWGWGGVWAWRRHNCLGYCWDSVSSLGIAFKSAFAGLRAGLPGNGQVSFASSPGMSSNHSLPRRQQPLLYQTNLLLLRLPQDL